MQARQRLQINTTITAVSVLIVLVMLVLTAYRVNRALEAANIADAILTASFERLMLRTDLHRTGSERAKVQLAAKHKEIGILLETAVKSFPNPGDQKIISELLTTHESIGKLSKTIRENMEKRRSGSSDTLSLETEDRLLSQLNMRVYDTIILDSKLQQSSKEAVYSSLKTAGGGIALVIIIVSAITLINSGTMSRAIARRIGKLREGVETIGRGNLDHRIEISGADEFTEFADSFNEMTAKLRESYRNLENEIVERRQAEESLRLVAAEQEAIFNSVPILISMHDKDGVWLRTNAAVTELFGFNPVTAAREEVAKRLRARFADGTPLTASNMPSSRALKGETVRETEYVITDGRGTDRTLLVNAVPLKKDGVVYGMVLSQMDITERKRADEALHASERRLIGVLESMPDAFVSFDTDMHYTYVNANAERLQAARREELLGKDVRTVYPDQESLKTISQYEQVIREQEPITSTSYHAVFDRWVEITAFPTPDGVSVFYKDVSAQMKAEQALRNSETRLRRFYESRLLGVIFWNMAGEITDANDKFLEMTGYDRTDLTAGRIDWNSMTPAEYRHLDEISARELKKTGANKEPYEKEFVRKDGSRLPILVAGAMLDEERFNGVAFVLDITKRKRMEEMLRGSEQKIRFHLENSPLAVVEWNKDFIITQWSVAAEQTFGWLAGEVIGNKIDSLNLIYEEDIPLVNQTIARLTSGKENTVISSNRNYTKAGAVIECTWYNSVLLDETGQLSSVMSLIQDITVRKQAEERLQASLYEKEVLLKEVHHRVKNNLQVISSLVNLQAGTIENPEVRDLFRDVRDRVRSMALVHEKLYHSESLSNVSFDEYAGSLMNYLWHAHGSSAASIRLTMDVQPISLSVEKAVPCGLILNELVTNALKHAFRGRSEGEVTMTLQKTPDGIVCLRVSDNGVGMPPGLDWRQSSSLGLRLVLMLAGQLHAKVETNCESGTDFLISFMLPEDAKDKG